MCEMCIVKPTDFGEIIPGFYFCLPTVDWRGVKAGHYVISNGMCVIATFPEKPWPDPLEGMTDDQIDALDLKGEVWKSEEAWLLAGGGVEDAFKMLPDDGWRMIEAARKVGCNPEEDGSFSMWLFHKAGEMLRDNPKGKTWEEQEAEAEAREKQNAAEG